MLTILPGPLRTFWGMSWSYKKGSSMSRKNDHRWLPMGIRYFSLKWWTVDFRKQVTKPLSTIYRVKFWLSHLILAGVVFPHKNHCSKAAFLNLQRLPTFNAGINPLFAKRWMVRTWSLKYKPASVGVKVSFIRFDPIRYPQCLSLPLRIYTVLIAELSNLSPLWWLLSFRAGCILRR